MPRPTDELRADHAVVDSGLAVLAAIGAHVRVGGLFPTDDAATVLRFLREFLVATHFRKENEVVWPVMAMQTGEGAAEAVGQLVRAQGDANDLVNSLVFFWEPVGELTEDERQGFADTIDALHLSMQRLQEREERLFGDCDADVPADDQIDWCAQFAAIEAGRTSRALWQQRLRDLAATWAA